MSVRHIGSRVRGPDLARGRHTTRLSPNLDDLFVELDTLLVFGGSLPFFPFSPSFPLGGPAVGVARRAGRLVQKASRRSRRGG